MGTDHIAPAVAHGGRGAPLELDDDAPAALLELLALEDDAPPPVPPPVLEDDAPAALLELLALEDDAPPPVPPVLEDDALPVLPALLAPEDDDAAPVPALVALDDGEPLVVEAPPAPGPPPFELAQAASHTSAPPTAPRNQAVLADPPMHATSSWLCCTRGGAHSHAEKRPEAHVGRHVARRG